MEKECLFCFETIKKNAIKCRSCGEFLDEKEKNTNNVKNKTNLEGISTSHCNGCNNDVVPAVHVTHPIFLSA